MVIEDGLTIEGKPLRDVYEAVGHAHAYDYIHTLAASKPLEESDILELHRLFYEKIDGEKAGHYRTVPVFISGSQYAVSPPARIGSDMKKFVKWFNDHEHQLPTPEFAALAHQKFVFIHPFIDGNGRVARLILNLALIRGEYTIALIPAVLRHEYVQSLEMSHKNPAVFVDFITDRIIATQMDLLRLLNVFVKPDEQNETCFNSAMARKYRILSNVFLHKSRISCGLPCFHKRADGCRTGCILLIEPQRNLIGRRFKRINRNGRR